MTDVAAHGEDRFDATLVDFVQSVFDDAREERKRTDGDRHHGGGAAQRCADHQPRQRDQGNQHHHEWQ
ncbi:hypothetical protein D3C77_635100 [compost metagenome]